MNNRLLLSVSVVAALVVSLPIAAQFATAPATDAVKAEMTSLPVATAADRHAVWEPLCGYLPGSVEPVTLGMWMSEYLAGTL